MLGALRMLPEVVGHLLHGERPAKPPESMRLRDLPSIPMYEGGWILLGERPGEAIALGLVGKFWRPVIEFARLAVRPNSASSISLVSRRPSTTSPRASSIQTGHSSPA